MLLLSACILMASVLFAGPVTKEQAQQIASQFLTGKGVSHRAPSPKQLKTEVVLNAVDKSGQPYLYAVTQGEEDGFVIVSGSDLTASVIGYSDKGTFDLQDIPVNMRLWLEGYINEIKWMEAHGVKSSAETFRRTSSVKQSVSPLLSTVWNQDSPYNDQCPFFLNSSERCVTGCVATAMAQIMYFHRYPEKTAKAIDAYACSTNWNGYGHINVTGVEANTVLDWANMKPTYNSSSDATAKTAVATLMKACGASVQMNYANAINGGSSASSSDAVQALMDYFGYDAYAKYVKRSDYSYSDWIELMYTEVAAGRPILYSGKSTKGGHAFVVDGYDDEDYFSVNWGWGGKSNGFFKVSLMNPKDQGIGGNSANEAYSMGQTMGIGIQPPTGVTPIAEPAALTITSIGLFVDSDHTNETASSSPQYSNGYKLIPNISIYNYTGATKTFDYGIRLTKDDESFTKDYVWAENSSFSSGGGTHTYKSFMLDPSTDSGITDGSYRVVCISKEHSAAEWQVDNGSEYNYITLTIGSNTMNATAVSVTPTVILSLVGSPTFSAEKAVVGQPYYITLKVTNSGTKDYHGDIVMRLTGYSNILAGVNCDINAGETKDIVLTYTASSAGDVGVTIKADETETVLYTGTITAEAATPSEVNVAISNVVTNREGDDIFGNCFSLQFDLTNNSSTVAYESGVKAYICIVTEELGGGYVNGVAVQTKYDYETVAASGSNTYKFDFKDLNYGDRYWIVYGYFNSSGNFVSTSTDVITVQHGIVTINANGDVTGIAPTATYEVPANAAAVDMTGISTLPKITKSANKNCLYVVDAGKTLYDNTDAEISDNVIKGSTAANIVLEDNANGFSTPVDFTATKISYTRTIDTYYNDGKGWTTIVLPFAASKVENSEGTQLPWDEENRKFWLMEFNGETGSTVNFVTASTPLKANTPYIIAIPGSDYGKYSLVDKNTLTFSADDATVKAGAKAAVTVSNYKFVGTMTNTGSLDDIYALNNDGDTFQKGTATVEPFRAYFAATSTAATATSLGISFGNSDTTGIEELKLSPTDLKREGVYNLNGQRVAQPTKGLYIVNGKKVVIK